MRVEWVGSSARNELSSGGSDLQASKIRDGLLGLRDDDPTPWLAVVPGGPCPRGVGAHGLEHQSVNLWALGLLALLRQVCWRGWAQKGAKDTSPVK